MLAFVVDDDVRIRRALCDELRRHLGSGNVAETNFAPDVAERVEEFRPELLFIDLSIAARLDMRARFAVPPALVMLSADNHALIRELRCKGLNAWTKPEVFLEIERILPWAEEMQGSPDRLRDQWVQAAQCFGAVVRCTFSKVCAFDGTAHILISASDVLAARRVGSTTEIALANRIVLSPYPLEFLASHLNGYSWRGRLLLSRTRPWRALISLIRMFVRMPIAAPKLPERRDIPSRTLPPVQ